MPTVDELYDEAIEVQQAGKLEEAVGKLESLVAEETGLLSESWCRLSSGLEL